MKERNIWTGKVDKEYEVEKEVVNKNDKGEDVKTITKEKVKKPVKLLVKEPTRLEREDADIFAASQINSLITRGVSSQSALRNRLFGDLVRKAEELQREYATLAPKDEKTKPDEQTQLKIDNLSVEYDKVLKELLSQEENHSGLFEKTAEFIVASKMDIYWTLFLSYYQEEGGSVASMFVGKTLEEKYRAFDELEDKREKFYLDAGPKFISIVSLWRRGICSTQEQFDKALAQMEKTE